MNPVLQSDNIAAEKVYTDPVCGMKVAANPDKSAVHAGRTYYFCSTRCVDKFNANPHAYMHEHGAGSDQAGPEKPSADSDAIYTCPMHPQVRQFGPGNCPICGMALEPLVASASEDTSELDDMKRRFWVSGALTLPLLVVTMSEFVPGLDLYHSFGTEVFNWLQAVLATPVVLWGGWPFFVRDLEAQHVQPDRAGHGGGVYVQRACLAVSGRAS